MTNTPTPPKQGVRARERNALERISGLEQDLQRLVGAVQQAFNESEAKLRDVSEVLDAAVALTPGGVDAIKAKMAELRTQRAADEATKAKEGLDNALLEGKVEQLQKIDADCIITGVEKDKEGNVIPPGYVQLAFSTIKPEFGKQMLDQGEGFTFATDGGGTFEVTGIYKAVPQNELPVVDPNATPAPAEQVNVPVPPAADGSPAMSDSAVGTPPTTSTPAA
jgi:hypothetical protein